MRTETNPDSSYAPAGSHMNKVVAISSFDWLDRSGTSETPMTTLIIHGVKGGQRQILHVNTQALVEFCDGFFHGQQQSRWERDLITEMVNLAELRKIDPADLDEYVHDLHSKIGGDKGASDINNGGLEEQITFLRKGYSLYVIACEELKSLIMSINK